MIFCTVGTQFPFDRLIDYLVRWREEKGYQDICFQVGSSEKYLPVNGYHVSVKEPHFSDYFDQAEFIVSHAGMGNIIRALEGNKAIVVVPRDSSLGEHVNNHQIDTVDSLSGLPNLFHANNYEQFCQAMSLAVDYKSEQLESNDNLERLIGAVSDFVVNS